MKRDLFVVMFLALCMACSAGATPYYEVDIVSFVVPTSQDWVADMLANNNLEINTILQGLELKFPISIDADRRLIQQGIEGNNGNILMTPHIGTFIESRVQAQNFSEIQYIDKSPDGTLTQHDISFEDSPGLWLDLTLETQNNTLVLNYSMRVKVIASRKKIPGLNLDIGEPVFSEMASQEIVPIDLSCWDLLDAMLLKEENSDSGNLLCVLIKVFPAKK